DGADELAALLLHVRLPVQRGVQVAAHGLQRGDHDGDLADAGGGQPEVGLAVGDVRGGPADGGERSDDVPAEEDPGGGHGQREDGRPGGQRDRPAGGGAGAGDDPAAAEDGGRAARRGHHELVTGRHGRYGGRVRDGGKPGAARGAQLGVGRRGGEVAA